MSFDLEIRHHRRQIEAFVRAEPAFITLKRPHEVITDAGGRVQDATSTVPQQTFRFVPFKRRLTREWGFSDDGESTKNVDWILVGAYDADIQTGDWFERNDFRYQVKVVSSHRLYRTAATLVERGPAKET